MLKLGAVFASCLFINASASAEVFELSKEDWQQLLPSIKTLDADPTKPQLSLKENQEKIAKAYLGVGFDIWNGSPMKQPCVSASEPGIYVPGKAGIPNPNNWDRVNDLSSLDEHYHNESLSASASITYKVFSIGGGVASSAANHYQSYSRYIDVDKGVVTGSVVMPASVQITKLASDALKSSEPSVNFTQVCGQRYVTEVLFGVAAKGTLDFQVAINDSTKKNSSSVRAGVTGIINGTLNTEAQWGEMSKISSTHYNVTGGPAETPAKESWLPTIRAFGSTDATLQSEHMVLLKTAPYTEISYVEFKNFKNITDDALGTMTNLIFVKGKAVQLLTDYQVALDPSAAEFFTSTPDEIKADVATLVKYVDDLSATYGLCKKAVDPKGVEACKAEASKHGVIPQVKPLTLAKQIP